MPRTQASLAVSADGAHWVLLNASPDIREQIARTPCLQPVGDALRSSPVAGVLLTNADVDHVGGLLSLRERQPLVLHATQRVLSVLAGNPIFGVLDRQVVVRRALPLNEEVPLRAADGSSLGLSVAAFAVPGKVALWLESAAPAGLAGGAEDTIGLRVTESASRARFFFLPTCAAMPEWLGERLRGAPLVFFDGTTWSDDEMRTAGVGAKTARRMGHMSINGPTGSLAAFAKLAVRRKIYIHLNNTNPVLLADSPERRYVEERGWEVAHDGLEVTL